MLIIIILFCNDEEDDDKEVNMSEDAADVLCDTLCDVKMIYKKNKEKRKTQIIEDLQKITQKYSLDFSKDIMKIFNDPIHGQIELHPLLVKIVDTPQFQRLRNIKQLGTKYLVYPGATHTRFEHSIGVAYLAGCLLRHLDENQPELNITKQDFLCVQIAALCHDMGHGPFSHLFDGMFIPVVKPNSTWEHENASVGMFNCMRKKNGLDKEMEQYGLNLVEDIKFIEELILKGQNEEEWSMKGRDEDKSFLYEIVANKLNGIDVDKWDYLARDCHYLGIPTAFDHERLLKSARVCEVCEVNKRKHICFRDKVAENIYGMFHTRYTLHRQALQHKIGYIIDVKIRDAFVLADDMLEISHAIDDMLEYTELTDHIFDQILNETNTRLKKCVGKAKLNENTFERILETSLEVMSDDEKIEEYKKILSESWKILIEDKLRASDFDICVSKSEIHKWLVSVNYNIPNKDYLKVQQKAEECFNKWCKKEECIDSDLLSEARSILGRVLNRQLPKFVGEARLKEDELKGDRSGPQPKAFKMKVYKKYLKKCWEDELKKPELVSRAKDFEIHVLEMGFGEVGNEPIENVYFYSKNEQNKAFKMEKYQVSSLKPRKFHEWLVRVYYNPKESQVQQKTEDDERKNREIQQKAVDFFHEWCKNKDFIDSVWEDKDLQDSSDSEKPSSSTHGAAAPAAIEEDKDQTSVHKIFQDPIHGQIELHPLLVKIIDTPQFQRLRNIKQLGGTYLVYPGATHTRFEHSIGAAYLAGRLLKVLQEKQQEDLKKNQEDLEKNQKDLKKKQKDKKQKLEDEKQKNLLEKQKILDNDILCVQIAALCYNLGHGPFSYVFTRSMNKIKQQVPTDETWEHEVASYSLFLDIVKEKNLISDLNDLNFIKKLMGVDIADQKTGRPEEKDFLYDIVANERNEIDVRKWDYLARDCHYLGIPNSFDHERMLKSARVCDVEETNHICFRDKVADNVYDMFHTLYTLYLQAYQHKIVNIIEDKIANAILEAKDTLKIPLKISESSSPDEKMRFIKLTDHVFEEILYSTDDKLKGARRELEDIVRRRLPKCVGETRITKDEAAEIVFPGEETRTTKEKETIFKRNWNEAVDEWNEGHPNVFLDKKDFSTDVIPLEYNKNGKNPINSVYFYKKQNRTKGYKIEKYEVSSLMPEKFTEYVGRVNYTKNSDEEEKDAKECFKWWRECVIQVYNKEDFKGNNCFITGDCPSLDLCGIEEVRSCKVNKGVWKLYEGRGYTDPHYLLSEGEYRDLVEIGGAKPAQSLKGVTSFEIQLYEKEGFEEPMHVTTVDCLSVADRFGMNAVRSCKVNKGVWKLYEGRDYTEPHYLLREGEYPTLAAMVATNPVQSLKRVTSFQIQLYEEKSFEEPMHVTTVDCPSVEDQFGMNGVRSCKVNKGACKLYEGRDYTDRHYLLSEGEYPNLVEIGAAKPVQSLKRKRERE
ncbi:uncharacterized protein LOC120458985 [Pimephales promelas]|uniref:uncharacterized protein LOC120458985 n=1 Tax=Pimephales promelas TaxID=90988 RepID=UPI001955B258|nr:uncharacterized protein LOC120458985 [Pimephales promelas]